MKQKALISEGREVSRPAVAKLLKRLIELQKLREEVRLAEVAMRPKPNESQAPRP